MLVRVTDHRGDDATIDSARVIKLRPALASLGDPLDTVLVDFATGGVFARGTLADIETLFAPHIRLAALHAPDGSPVRINAKGIAAIARDPQFAGNSVAIVTEDFANPRVPARNRIALRETVAEAETIVQAARARRIKRPAKAARR
jgi:hypothetical protein